MNSHLLRILTYPNPLHIFKTFGLIIYIAEEGDQLGKCIVSQPVRLIV
jgi:hypothetical protein